METNNFMEEQDEKLEEFEEVQQRRYSIGKAIVYTIVGINLISVFSSYFILKGSFFKMLVQIGLNIALLFGVSWVRYLYIVSGILSAILLFISFFVTLGMGIGSWIWIVVFEFALVVVETILLLSNKSVKEYMYQRGYKY